MKDLFDAEGLKKWGTIAAFFWLAGFVFVSFDRFLTVEVANFTVKIYFFCFALASCFALPLFLASLAQKKLHRSLLLFVPLLLYSIYSFANGLNAVFFVKSMAYNLWLLFDIISVGLLYLVLSWHVPNLKKYTTLAVCLGIFIVGGIIVIDAVAFYFGYEDGLIGFNQYTDLKQKMANAEYRISRPHAFSYEPSYAALYLSMCFFFLAPLLLDKGLQLKARFLYLTLILLSLTATLCTVSRSAFATILLTFFILIFAASRRAKKALFTVFKFTTPLLLVVALVFFFGMGKNSRDNIFDNYIFSIVNRKDGVANARMRGNVFAAAIAKETNYLGAGMGSQLPIFSYLFFKDYRLMRYDEAYNMRDFDLHGNFLLLEVPVTFNASDKRKHVILSIWGEIFAENGIPGILLFAAFLFLLLQKLYKNKNRGIFHASLFASCFVLSLFSIHWFPNFARTDIWVWYAIFIGSINLKG